MRADMKSRRIPFPVSGLVPGLLSGCLLASSLAAAAPAGRSRSTPSTLDAAFAATYPASARPARSPVAGVELARLVLPGLRLSARSERAAQDGGLVLSFADGEGAVRARIHLAVFASASEAQKEVDAELHGVSTQLLPAADPTLGEPAWADDGGKGTALLIAAQANVAYSVTVLQDLPGLSAAAIAGLVRTAMVAGTPRFPAAAVTLPASIAVRQGEKVRVTVAGDAGYTLRAEGGYIARSATGPVVRPLGPGAVTVQATVVDALGRVTVAAATTVAK